MNPNITCEDQEAGRGNMRLKGLLNIGNFDSPVLQQTQRPGRLGLGIDLTPGIEQPGGGWWWW